MYSVYGDAFYDSDLTDGNLFVQVVMNDNYLLRHVRTSIILCNCETVTLSNLQMKIYIDRSELKGSLLYTSTNNYSLADINGAYNSGVRSIYFTFNDVPLDASHTYDFCLTGTATNLETLNGGELQTLAWKKSYPYPEHRGGFALLADYLPKYPYDLCLIGAKF